MMYDDVANAKPYLEYEIYHNLITLFIVIMNFDKMVEIVDCELQVSSFFCRCHILIIHIFQTKVEDHVSILISSVHISLLYSFNKVLIVFKLKFIIPRLESHNAKNFKKVAKGFYEICKVAKIFTIQSCQIV